MRVRVSDHALLRWYMRMIGVDLEAMRAQLAERIMDECPGLDALGTKSEITIDCDDMRIVLKGRVVVTILPPGGGGQ